MARPGGPREAGGAATGGRAENPIRRACGATGGLLSMIGTSVGPAAVPVSVVRAVRDAGSARQSGPLRIFAFWFWVVGDHPSRISSHVSSQSVTSVKAVVARGAVAACNGAATRSGRPRHTDTPRTMGGYRARSGIAPQTSRRTDGGEAESHTRRSSTDTLHVSARSMWPALSPRSYLAFSTAACGHAPRRAGLGGRPRSRTRCGHARWLRWLRA